MHRIDPRIVIIQIALSGICAFWIFKPLAMLCEVIFLMSFLLYLQHPKEALRLGVWFAFLVGLYALLNESNAPQIIVQPVFLLRKLSPLLGVMVLSLKALTVSELFMGLQKLHCPKSATLALAVALRFIPTIRHELEQIRNGMKTRGVPLNVITFAKAPAMTTEYMIIPFIMRCIKVADELSAAAVTRAIENPVPRGMRVPLKIRIKDIVYQTASSMGRFKGAVLKVRDITTAWYKHCYPFMSISQVVMPSTIAFVLPVGVVLLSGGTTTLNEVILCILLSMGLVGSLQAMIEFWHDIAAIYEIQPRIMALLEAKELPEPIEAQHSSGNDVELKDVHFSYGAIEVIHGVSFTAKAGTVTALVGPSGSGKSTLAKLIARFWDVSAGAVTVGGADIRNLPLSELSEKISYVSQDNFLFNMSLRDNIRIGKPDATDAEVERAASLARCDDFIARFPNGYDTNAGDAGARLSGGERQRLAIARAILKDAPIIILDEATAFTDPENEDKLQQSIDHLTKGKTLIVIAHRLSTIMYADKILVLEDGAISAEGTHEQLLSSSQTYLDMWKAHISAMDWSMNKEAEILC